MLLTFVRGIRLKQFHWLIGLLWLLISCNPTAMPPLPKPTPTTGLQIAWLIPTSGEAITFGRLLRQGSRMAVDEWNERGGVLQQHVMGRVYDTPCDYEAARQITQQAVQDGFRFIIGPPCSEAAIAAAVVAQEAHVLLLSPTATHPLVTADGHGQTRPTVFRVALAPTWQGQAMAHWTRHTLKVTRVAIWNNPQDDYAVALSAAFAQQWVIEGGQVITTINYNPTEADFKAKLTQSAHAEAIYLPAEALVVNRVASQLNELGLSKPLLGNDNWQTGELDVAQIKQGYMVRQIEPSQVNQAWAARYQADYAVAPETLAILGYETTDILLNAINQANSLEVSAVAESLSTGTFTPLAETITFDKRHDPLRPVPMMKIMGKPTEFVEFVQP
jgi:branched-chain amino acid transport system substrate-binding protein